VLKCQSRPTSKRVIATLLTAAAALAMVVPSYASGPLGGLSLDIGSAAALGVPHLLRVRSLPQPAHVCPFGATRECKAKCGSVSGTQPGYFVSCTQHCLAWKGCIQK
jgi:hypothetical protein